MSTLIEALFQSIGIQTREDLQCLIRALESQAWKLESDPEWAARHDADLRRTRRMLTQARKRLGELS